MSTNIRKLFLLSAVCILLASIFIGCSSEPIQTSLASNSNETPNLLADNISSLDAYNLIQNNSDNPDFVVFDVRTAEERAVSYIEGSLLLDWNSGSFQDMVPLLDKSRTYLLY